MELLISSIDPDYKRRLELRQMNNHELSQRYDNELVLRLHSAKNLRDTRNKLSEFREYLNERPPSPDLAKAFLTRYADRKPRTRYRYTQMIKAFMQWYGQPIDDLKVRIPKSLPLYTEDQALEKLLRAIDNHKTHKSSIPRDRLMVEVDVKTGMRRLELAELEARDVYEDFLIVRDSKYNKDRVIPLAPALARKLNDFVRDMQPNEKVFKLSAPSITMKIKYFARKAGLDESFHAHCLRHKFATQYLVQGGDIFSLQKILGHSSLEVVRMYINLITSDILQQHRKFSPVDNAILPRGKRKT